ncbi:MAG: hypothetical protein LN414_00695, partial [Candidatus Thermoplasmatota archaeon]|nr:hypothetical protein [Candidatus Thermoplasmatota archaeon]
ELLVRNTGNGPDAFIIALPDGNGLADGWWVHIPQANLDVPLRSQVIAELVLTAPDPALVGTSVEFTVSASSNMSSMSKEVTFSARVIQFYSTSVVVNDMIISGDVNQTIVIPLSISNGGNGPVVYNGDINFPDQTWVGGLDIANLTLAGYKDAPANLTFTVPSEAINRSYDFTMVVISSGGEIQLENFTFSVNQFHDLLVKVVSETPTVTQGEQAFVRLKLENRGNGIENVTLTATPPSTWTFEFSDRVPVLDAFSEAFVDLRFDTDVNTPGGANQVDVLAYYGPSKLELIELSTVVNVLTRPDLMVMAESLNLSDTDPYVDMIVRVTTTIRNDGQTLARDVFAQLYVDGMPERQPQYVSTIEAGEEETLTFIWTTNASGLRELRIVADFQDDIDEVDETNNELSITVKVSKADLKTSPGLSHAVALLAMSTAFTITWNQRRKRSYKFE